MSTVTKEKPAWIKTVREYQKPSVSTSVWQVVNSFGPFLLILVLMYLSLSISYLLTLALSVLAGAFIMRIFIIQHDAGHGSFFDEKRWNTAVGIACSLFTLTPYEFWRHSHAVHHAHNGDLEWRGTGDVYTMTLNEYYEGSWWRKLGYRIYRHPLIMFPIGAPLQFILFHRAIFQIWGAKTKQGRWSLIRTDLMILAVLVLAHFTIGLTSLALVYVPVIFVASIAGVFMFFVQHQFEDAYWSTAPDWDYAEAALKGSSYFRLPKLLQWFTGNIGLHHIHHLSPKIPNYELQRCHDENPDFQDVPTIDIRESLRIVIAQYALWDEEQEKLLTFRQARRRMQELKNRPPMQHKATA